MSGLGRLRVASIWMAGAWVRGGGLAAAIGLLAACNHELRPPPSEGGGGGTPAGGGDAGSGAASGTGITGIPTATGLGRLGPDGTCPGGNDFCIDSCALSPPVQSHWESAYCDATGAYACADGRVKLSSCAPDTCAKTPWLCCIEATGLTAYPPCTADGRQGTCPAGSHTWDEQADCIPTSLGVTDCAVLNGSACGGPTALDRCSSRTPTTKTDCSCLPLGDFAGAGTWQCETTPI